MADVPVPRSSFIPKQAPGGGQQPTRRRRRFNVLGLIGSVVIVGTLILAGGVFFYDQYTKSGLEAEKQSLEQQRSKFNEADISSLQELNRRINAAKYLLGQHLSPSIIFDRLEINTKQPVQFSGFNYERRDSGDVTLTLTGVTDDFASVALQALQFKKDTVLSNSAVTALTEANTTNGSSQGAAAPLPSGQSVVNFTLASNIAQASIGYDGQAYVSALNASTTGNVGSVITGGDTSASSTSAGFSGTGADTASSSPSS